jgi:hypothetical protein
MGDDSFDDYGELAAIVVDLASIQRDDILSDYQYCVLCCARNTREGVSHTESCPYRRAVEWRLRHASEPGVK